MDDSNEIDHACMVQNQQCPNVTYKVLLLFTKYVCCTCEWALHGNLHKHQVVILLLCTNITKKNIIQYCGTWCGSNCEGFVAMFGNFTYLHLYDNESNDEEPNEDDIEKPWVVNMGELLTLDDTSPNVEGENAHNQPLISNTPTKRAPTQMDDVVQEIINEVKEGMGFNSLTMPHHYCVWLHQMF
jgi:hypothetical protein